MPNETKRWYRSRCSIKKKEAQLEKPLCSSRDHDISGIPQASQLIRSSPVGLESEFSNWAGFGELLAQVQLASAPMQSTVLEEPVLGLIFHFRACKDSFSSSLLRLSPPELTVQDSKGSLERGAISGPRLCMCIWPSRSTL